MFTNPERLARSSAETGRYYVPDVRMVQRETVHLGAWIKPGDGGKKTWSVISNENPPLSAEINQEVANRIIAGLVESVDASYE